MTNTQKETPRESTPRKLANEEQVDRLRNLAAYGPLGRRPVDDELDARGWTERYDGDETATDLREGRAAILFDRGRVHRAWSPHTRD